MKCYSITGNFIHPEEIKNESFKKFILRLTDNNLVDLYSSFNLVQLISVLTEKDYNIIYNIHGQREMIPRKHIVKITEVK